MSVSQRAGACTMRGSRPTNQDAVLATVLPMRRRLVAVADGMGGHASGEVASSMALDVLAAEVRAGRSLVAAVERANAAIHEAGQRDGARHGMGTTLVAVLADDDYYEVVNVGDSRAYLVCREAVRQITLDHSFRAEALRSGRLTASDVERGPWRHALMRSLGSSPEVEVDRFGPFATGDRAHAVVLCSDGVHKVLGDEALAAVLRSASDTQAAADAVARLAVASGSDDNASAAVLEVGAFFAAAPAASPRILLTSRPVPSGRPVEAPRARSSERLEWGMMVLLIGMLMVLLAMALLQT